MKMDGCTEWQVVVDHKFDRVAQGHIEDWTGGSAVDQNSLFRDADIVVFFPCQIDLEAYAPIVTALGQSMSGVRREGQ